MAGAILIALGLFLLLGLAVYKTSGKRMTAKEIAASIRQQEYDETIYGENPDHVEMSRYFMQDLDKDTLSREKGSETMGRLYGHREGDVLEALDFENYEGEVSDEYVKTGVRFRVSEKSMHGPPEGMEDIGYVHGHRNRQTPKSKIPDELKEEWSESTPAERKLFPSKKDIGWLHPGEVMIISSPQGDYRPWAVDEEGHAYSPGLAVKREHEEE